MKRYFIHSFVTCLILFLGGLPIYAQENQGDAIVRIETNKGTFWVKLYGDTPIHQKNFLSLVKEGAYNHIIFHRVINHFMVQAGGNKLHGDSISIKELETKHSETLPAEIKYPEHYHMYGALAAARTGDEINPEKRSSSFQFYIVTGQVFLDIDLDERIEKTGIDIPENIRLTYKTKGGTPHLDNGYTVFGEVIKGMKTIEKIEKVKTDDNDQPLQDVYIKETVIERFLK